MLSRVYNNKKTTLIVLPIWLLVSVMSLTLGGEVITSGASLFVAPSAGTHAVGHVFSMDIRLATKDPANVVSLTIVYPPDALEVLDVSRQNSLLTLWIEEPEYNATPGIVHFSGGVHRRPGFTGEGSVLTVLFRPKKPGLARVDITDALVLLGDGKGTDVLREVRGGVYTFIEDGAAEFDLDGNGKVDMKDIAVFAGHWGNAYDVHCDFDRNEKIDLNDLMLLVLVLVRQG